MDSSHVIFRHLGGFKSCDTLQFCIPILDQASKQPEKHCRQKPGRQQEQEARHEITVRQSYGVNYHS